MKKKIVFLLYIFGIISIILMINFLKPNNNADEETMKCIASKTTLYLLKTCSHCSSQKEILGDYVNLFNIVDCTENQTECIAQGIKSVPTWIINRQKYSNVFSIKQLKELTNC